MPKETLEQVRKQSGMGNILISAYRYLRDNGIALGTQKTPSVVSLKVKEPDAYFHRIISENTNFTNTPVFAYRCVSEGVEARIMTVSAAVKSNKPVVMSIYKNPTFTAIWDSFDTSQDIEKATQITNVNGGRLVGGLNIPETGGEYVEVSENRPLFPCRNGDIILFTVDSDSNSDFYMNVRVEAVKV